MLTIFRLVLGFVVLLTVLLLLRPLPSAHTNKTSLK